MAAGKFLCTGEMVAGPGHPAGTPNSQIYKLAAGTPAAPLKVILQKPLAMKPAELPERVAIGLRTNST
jgi:hypothetical protein